MSRLRSTNVRKRFRDLAMAPGATPDRIVALVGSNRCAGVDCHVPFGGRNGSSHGSREQGRDSAAFHATVETAHTAA